MKRSLYNQVGGLFGRTMPLPVMVINPLVLRLQNELALKPGIIPVTGTLHLDEAHVAEGPTDE